MELIDKIKNFDRHICSFNIALFLRTMILLTPVMLLFYQENGLTVRELFLFQSFFYLTSIIMEAPVGSISDHLSRKCVLVISYSIFIFVTIMWILFHGYWIILCGEILLAVSKVMLDNAQSGFLYDYLTYKNDGWKMPKLYGYLNFFLSAGTTAAAIIGTWLYINFGSKTVLSVELIILLVAISLIFSLPNVYKPANVKNGLFYRIKKYLKSAGIIYRNKDIMNYVYYSGFLTAFSIVFALSFQPLMLKVLVPVALFGVAAFLNHGVRALFSAITGRVSKLFSIRTMIIPLYFLFLIAFGCIFVMLHIQNKYLIMLLIAVVCLIIGCQLLFTIRHVSRLHKLVPTKIRGTLISVNNVVSRSLAFIVLFSSKIFMDKLGFENYYSIILGLFVVFGFILMLRAYGIKEIV